MAKPVQELCDGDSGLGKPRSQTWHGSRRRPPTRTRVAGISKGVAPLEGTSCLAVPRRHGRKTRTLTLQHAGQTVLAESSSLGNACPPHKQQSCLEPRQICFSSNWLACKSLRCKLLSPIERNQKTSWYCICFQHRPSGSRPSTEVAGIYSGAATQLGGRTGRARLD